MKRLFLVAALAAALATPAKSERLAPNWTGFYVGLNGGYGFGPDRDVINTEFNAATGGLSGGPAKFGSLSLSGGFAGVQVGANIWQMGNWVFGLEGDVHWADISDSTTATVINFIPTLNATISTKNHVSMFGTIRPRLGLAWGGTLLYATGGFAFGHVKFDYTFVDNFNFSGRTSVSSMRGGYAVGGGLEFAFAPNMSVKAEYQYIDLGSETYLAPLFLNVVNPTVFVEHTNIRTDFHAARIGVNWKPVLGGR